MDHEMKPTTPKPFVFVLMPFDSSFDDTYKFGIKGAAQDVGAYAERVDEQIFTEGILDRIFNQISKADIIVADMTGRNPNVFYEVGYAHALGKIVLLLTRDANDIPFDLKQRQHTVYGGSIERLRKELVEKLKWAIGEAKARKEVENQNLGEEDYLDLELEGMRLRPAPIGVNGPTVEKREWERPIEYLVLRAELRNPMLRESPPAHTAYLFCHPDSFVTPFGKPPDRLRAIKTIEHEIVSQDEAPDGLVARYALDWRIPSLPRGAYHALRLGFSKDPNIEFDDDIPMRIQIHFPNRYINYPFILHFRQSKSF